MAPAPGSLCQDAHKTARARAISADQIGSYLVGREDGFKYRFYRQFEQISSVLGDSLLKGSFSRNRTLDLCTATGGSRPTADCWPTKRSGSSAS